MKIKLLFAKQYSSTFYILLVCCLCFNLGWSQTNLILNGTADEHTSSTSDNADAWDMTPNDEIKNESGVDIPSPYQAIWDNDALEDYLEDTYNPGGSVEEQPGSSNSGTYNGATKTRSVKLYNDGDPVAKGVSTRRLYQKVLGLKIGTNYTFSVDSRSEAVNVPSEVFILNEEITTEVGLENGVADSRVDAFFNITNDFNSSSGSESENTFTTNTLTFMATTTSVVIYIRALGATSEDNEVFYDNMSLVEEPTASVNDVLANSINVYPNPVKDYISIESNNVKISSVEIYNVIGKRILLNSDLNDNKLEILNLIRGVYLLKINANDRTLVKKVVVE